jgi:hypothetical protein
MDLHPAVAFGAAIAGGTLIGPLGAIMALPFAGVVQAFVSTIMQRHNGVGSHLTELEQVEDTEGDPALRSAMKKLLRREAEGSGDDTALLDAPEEPPDR